MAEGIIFGGYLLSKDEFLSIFFDWYQQRKNDLKRDLQTQVIDKIEVMIKVSERYSKSKGTYVPSIRRVKEKYDAQQIHLAWQRITQEYFGNREVTLIAAAKFGSSEYTWTNNILETDAINKQGISIQKKGLDELNKTMELVGSIYAAQDVQSFLNIHYNNLLTVLDTYTLNSDEAAAMRHLLATRKSLLNNASFQFAGSTYNKIIFDSQRNAEGKKLDAFMNHIGDYNKELFGAMRVSKIQATAIKDLKLDDHGGFEKIFPNKNKTQPWLLDSLNSTSWLSGGDIVVVDAKGAVLYNIQLKSTSKGKTFEVAPSLLLSLARNMVLLIDSDNPTELAELMFNRLKTSSSNEFVRADAFIESEAYKMVKQNLKIT